MTPVINGYARVGQKKLRIHAEDTALLVIDMQESFRDYCGQRFLSDDVIKVTQRLLEAAKILGLRTLVTEHVPPQWGHTIAELQPLLKELDAAVVPKMNFSAYSVLKEHLAGEVKNVVVCGVAAHCCVSKPPSTCLTMATAFISSLMRPLPTTRRIDYVGNDLKHGFNDNGTYYWLGGKHMYIERTNQTFWLFEYRGYYENVPVSLLPTDINEAVAEGRTCLAGHTKNHTTLHARPCDEKLPAVCYNYRNVAKHFCRQDFDKQWTLFQGKCYYVYSAPRGEDKKTFKTYFEAQEECKEMGATLATVTDEATFKKTLDLATGLEITKDMYVGSWIGLQLSAKGQGGIYYNITDGTTRNFTKGRVEGWWEDGTPYDAAALKPFWATEQPDEKPLVPLESPDYPLIWSCNFRVQWNMMPADYNWDRCMADGFQHCANVFPSGSIADCPACSGHDNYVGKWNDDWCYSREPGYICQRDPKPNPAYYAVEGRCVPSNPSSALLRL